MSTPKPNIFIKSIHNIHIIIFSKPKCTKSDFFIDKEKQNYTFYNNCKKISNRSYCFCQVVLVILILMID